MLRFKERMTIRSKDARWNNGWLKGSKEMEIDGVKEKTSRLLEDILQVYPGRNGSLSIH